MWAAIDTLLPVHAARQSTHGHGALLLVRHMLAELARAPSAEPAAEPQSDAYALHMRLPMGDYFTSAAMLDDGERAALKTGGADVVAIAPELAARASVPTLGDRAPARGARTATRSARTDTAVPAAFLSYGCYGSSLGPAYDSAGSTLSHEQSARTWRAQRRFRRELNARWGAKFSGRVDAELRAEHNVPSGDALAADAASLDSSLDAGVLAAAIEGLDVPDGVDEELADNWDIVRELQDVQWLRLRATYTGGKPAPPPPALAAYEQMLAAELIEQLTRMMLAKAPARTRDIPPRPLLLASMAALATSVTRPTPGYYGTLDGRSYAPTSRAQLDVTAGTPVPPPVRTTWAGIARPTVLADNCVAHWEPNAAPGTLSARAAEHAGTPGDFPGAPSLARPFPYARPPVPYGMPQPYGAPRGRPAMHSGL